MRTVSAAFSPFFAAALCTPSGKCPVVVQGPDNRDLVLADIGIEHLNIDIVVTHRMDVDQIRFYLLEFLNEQEGIDHIEITVQSKKDG